MGEKIVVGPVNKGLRTDRTPFIIDNDSFPSLINAYQWRGRVKRKRGTSLLGRLQRYFNSASTSYGSTSSFTLSSGAGNLLTAFGLQAGGNLVPGTISFVDSTASNTYTDPSANGVLVGAPSGSGTVNYATGAITVVGGGGDTINTVTFNYYPDLPVMGLEDLVLNATQFPGTIAFDTVYSYNIVTTSPYNIYDVSFYKNPPLTAAYTGYIQKTVVTPTSWNGRDFQQFWTTNYQGALWATNGINVPFSTANIGMQYKTISTVTVTSGGPPAIVNLKIIAHGLVVGDFVFINEVATTTGINFQTGYVTVRVDADNVTVEFPNATIASNGTGGIAQYLTNRVSNMVDCLRWYDGDPTTPGPVLNGNLGWVNFAPPISRSVFPVADLPAAQYYLVGARMILPFKDRLLFIGPVVQTSAGNDTTVNSSQVYLQDTVIYSQNGTPYYTASFTGDPSFSTTTFYPILTPTKQSATASAYFSDQTGFGGFISAGFSQPILTASPNEDVILLGFSNRQTRFVYTGNDIVPFNFYVVNSELGSASTFSSVTLDRGALTVGTSGIILTAQIGAQRIDLSIPDQIFQFNLTNNGAQRVSAQRDFINEWIYFSYPSNQVTYNFPSQTLQYNYRDESWAIFNECYTTYGAFRRSTGQTWASLTSITWSEWNTPWNSGDSTLLQPQVIGGNQQGFLLFRDEGTGEGNSLYITNIQGPEPITGATQANPCVLTVTNDFLVGQMVFIENVVGMTQLNGNYYTITAATPTSISINVNSTLFTAYVSGGTVTPSVFSPNHCLNSGDYIVINGCIGTIASLVNGEIFQVANPTTNNFFLDFPLSMDGTYSGGGVIQRMYVPFIQSKQFPVSWGMARKTRLGPQQYLFTTTNNGQITLLIFLSQNASSAYNFGPIVPAEDVLNDSLVYSTVVYTCPEGTNLGLTPANINLNLVTSMQQAQTWHRMNTSLLGDTVQIGVTMDDAQMRDTTFSNQFAEIELHGFIIDASPSQVLA